MGLDPQYPQNILTLYILEKHPLMTALGHKTSLLAVLHSLGLRQDEKKNYNSNNN
jgi:hypothetical protein